MMTELEFTLGIGRMSKTLRNECCNYGGSHNISTYATDTACHSKRGLTCQKARAPSIKYAKLQSVMESK